jgi:hypothetical protein
MSTIIWGRPEVWLENEEGEGEMSFTASEAKEKEVF